MLRMFTRKGVSICLATLMLVGMCPAIGVTAETAAPAFCNVLFEEDFENVTTENSSKINFVNTSVKATNEITQNCEVVAEGAYAQGAYTYAVTNSESPYLTYALFDTTHTQKIAGTSVVHSEGTDYYGYTVDLSFDWDPVDNGSAPATTLALYGNSVAGAYASKPIMGIIYTGGNQASSGRTVTIFRNGTKHILAEDVDLTEKLGNEAMDAEHVYRMRFVFKTWPEMKDVTISSGTTSCAGEFSIYIDGVEIGTYAYIKNKEREFITSLECESTNKAGTAYFDNVKMVEYWDALTADTEGTVPYKNDDALVAEIRAAEYKYDKLVDADKVKADGAIAMAKSVHEDAASTQEQFDSAATELKGVMDALEVIEGDDGGGEEDTPPAEDDYDYIVNNDFESVETAPFSSGFVTVADNSEIMGKVMKLSGTTGVLSDAFKGVNIITDTGDEKRDSVFEFDIRLEKYKPENGVITLALWDARYRESVKQPITKLSFEGNGILRETGSTTDTEPLKISQADLSDGKWHRIRIINHSWFAENDQNMYRMSLYVDGECEYPHIRRKSYSKGKVDEFSQFELAGIPSGTVVYMDNIKVYSTTSTSENIPVDAGKLMKTVWELERFLDTAVIGTEEGTYNIEDINEVREIYNGALATVPSLRTQTEVDSKYNELQAALSVIRPIGDDVAVDSITYSTDNLAADGVTEVTASVSVSTTRNASNVNDFTIVTALYRNSNSYSGGELVAMASDTIQLSAKQSKTMTTTLDLSAYTTDARMEMYAKTFVLTGENRTQNMETAGSVVGSENENTVKAEKLYGESAEMFKKVLEDGTVKFSLSLVADKNDDIIVYTSKDGEKLTNITGNDIASKFEYFNIINTGDDGEVVCEFSPDEEGEYTVTAYSLNQSKEIYSAKCIYKDKSAIEAALAELKNDSTTINSHKALLDLDTAKFAAAEKNGIEMDGLAEYVFNQNPNADVYGFKTWYLKNMNMLYAIKTASNADEVLAALEEFDIEPLGVTPYELRSIGAYIYTNKSKATSIVEFHKLLGYRPPENNGIGGSIGSGVGVGSYGGTGGGYINTAEEEVSEKNETPYEQVTGVFRDLDGFEWAQEAIMFMAGRNVINGKSEGVFSPADNITREEFAKIVVNMFEIPEGDGLGVFSDVDVNAWYCPYVEAAYSSGIVNGIGDNIFGAGTLISREDACVMLYRAGKHINVEYSDKAEFFPFDDECSDYAREAVESLAKSGIVNGTGNNVFQAAKPLTRAEAAKMIYGLYCFAQ